MNVSRNHLVPNTTLRLAFDDDFKSLKVDACKVLNELLPKSKANSDCIEIPTCFYADFMRWLSKFLGELHLELNSEDLEKCKLSMFGSGKLLNLDESSGDLSASDGISSLGESETCLDKLEVLDPNFNAIDVDNGNDDDNDNGDLGDPIIIVPGDDPDEIGELPNKKMKLN